MATASPERIVNANGVDLCLQEFGAAADPAVVLLAGSGASMLHFGTPFCERIAASGRHVVRFDYRDTGRSVTYPIGDPPYDGPDLADDVVALLDALAIRNAHLAGISMGGGIAQYLALHEPARLASLTLMSTSPAAPGRPARDLPGMSPELAAAFAEVAEPDWSDAGASVEYVFELERLCAPPGRADEAFIRRLAEDSVSRANSIGALTNHFRLGDDTVEPAGALATIEAPTLVIHGTEDPLFPIDHGRAIAAEIPGAELLELVGVGHELPPRVWPRVADAIVAHTVSASG